MKHEEIVKEVGELVKSTCFSNKNPFGKTAWNHIKNGVKYSLILSEKLNADKEVVEIAALLHDYGSIIGEYKEHHIVSSKKAEEILKGYNYPTEKIENIKHCIYTHRSSKGLKKETVEAEIVASADVMAHFDEIIDLLRVAFITHKMNLEESTNFIINKIEKDMNKIMPEGKEIIKEKYDAFKLLFER